MYKKKQIMMFGPDLNVMGGISSVIREYLVSGLPKKTKLIFIPTTKDGSKKEKIIFFLSSLIKSFQLLISYKKSICHIHVSQNGSFYRKLIILTLVKLFRHKAIVHLHGAKFEAFMRGLALNRWLSKKMFISANLVITLSEKWKDTIERFCPNARTIKLYNPISRINISKVEKNHEGIRILFLGRLSHRKGIYDLINCILDKKFYLRSTNTYFVLAGDGDIENVRNYVREQELENLVSITGWISGTEKQYQLQNADIYVLPSYNEQMPMSILEAMAYGLPIISTKIAGIPEMVCDGLNGTLINPGDRGALTAALIDLIENPKKREYMGRENEKRVAVMFDGQVIVEKLIMIYNSI